MRRGAQAQFVVPTEFGVEFDAAARRVIDDVLGARRREAAVRAREDGQTRGRLVGDAEAGDDLRERGAAGDAAPRVAEAVGALELDVFDADARRDGQFLEKETVLDEAGVSPVAPLVIFDDRAVARAGEVAVLLHAMLRLVVRAHPEVGLAAHAEESVPDVQVRLDAEEVISAQPSLVAAGGVEVGEAAAVGVNVQTVRAL